MVLSPLTILLKFSPARLLTGQRVRQVLRERLAPLAAPPAQRVRLVLKAPPALLVLPAQRAQLAQRLQLLVQPAQRALQALAPPAPPVLQVLLVRPAQYRL